MFSGQIQTLLQFSKPSIETLQTLHCLLLKTSLDRDEYFFSNLVLFAVSASVHHARQLFDNSPISPPPLFALNTLVKAYSKSSPASSTSPAEAVKLFAEFRRTPGGLRPDKFTYPFVIKACGRCSMLGAGGSVHSMVLKSGFGSDSHVNNTLLTMYSGCGVIEFARKVFDEMPERNVVSWSSLIAAYVGCNLELGALRVFKDMITEKEKPNLITFISLVSACTNLLNPRLGKSIHSYILVNGIELQVGLGTALINMYSKSGYLDEALCIFNSITEKNLQSWTVMISCLADYGHGEEAISLFTQMERTSLRPDSVLFSAILSACSHRGLVCEGKELFQKMVNVYNIMPTMEHYGCMVDLFGRVGRTEEAYEIIVSMPMKPNPIILRSYLSACKHHGRVVFADKSLMRLLLEIEPEIGANYVLAANVSSSAGYWNDMKEKGVRKVPGYSWS